MLRIGFVPRPRTYAARYKEDRQLFRKIIKETQMQAFGCLLDFEHFESPAQNLSHDLDGICSMARNPTTLSLLSCFEMSEGPVVNTVSSVRKCLDTASTLMFLMGRGVPVPLSSLHRRAFSNLEYPTILKNIASFGAKARKTIILNSRRDLANHAKSFQKGLWIAQRLLQTSALVKVYVVGTDVISVKELQHTSYKECRKFNGNSISEVSEISLLCGSLIGLEVYNVELIIDRDGIWAIDINDFPSFFGISEAPRIIAQYLTKRFKK